MDSGDSADRVTGMPWDPVPAVGPEQAQTIALQAQAATPGTGRGGGRVWCERCQANGTGPSAALAQLVIMNGDEPVPSWLCQSCTGWAITFFTRADGHLGRVVYACPAPGLSDTALLAAFPGLAGIPPLPGQRPAVPERGPRWVWAPYRHPMHPAVERLTQVITGQP